MAGKSPKVCWCGKISLPGLAQGVALCRYHFDAKIYGKEWADECALETTKPEE